jgi:hypothetical protein
VGSNLAGSGGWAPAASCRRPSDDLLGELALDGASRQSRYRWRDAQA